MFWRLFNISVRLGSLAAKLVLSLYMARYFSLSDMGTYGLVAACVAIAIPFLGLRLDFMAARRLVDASPYEVARILRDEAVFYGLSYLLLAVTVLTGVVLMPSGTSAGLALFALALGVLESFCTITCTNFIYLKRPVLSNLLFFIRAAAWTLPVIGLGMFDPQARTVNFVLSWWLGGVGVSLVISCFMLRSLPWGEVFRTRVDWAGLRRDIRKCLPIWVGSVGAIAGGNVDRFVVEYYLSRDFVGIVSFYGSFVTAIGALISSGVVAFIQPVLVSLHGKNEVHEFHKLIRKMVLEIICVATVMAFCIGVVVPVFGQLFKRPEFFEYAAVLWLMLFGVWLKMASEGLEIALYAGREDGAIWRGNLLFLVTSLGGNLVLVPLFGIIGVGFSSIVSAIIIGAWRIRAFRNLRMGSDWIAGG